MTFAGFDRRDLRMLINLFRMSLSDRFLGSSLGLIWAVLSPLLMLGIFCFVFTVVFPSRLPGRNGPLPYLIWLISGYGPWLALSEGLSLATTSVVSSAGVVKNIAFKSELLPMVGVLLGLVPLTVAFALLVVLLVIAGGPITLSLLTVVPTVLVLFVFVSGLGLFLGALNVFVRDTALVLPNALTLLLFASPIFYPITSYPTSVRGILGFSPFYVLSECFRSPVLNGLPPPVWMLLYIAVIATVCFAAGLWWFRRLKNFFDTRL